MSLQPISAGIGQPVRRREDLRLLTGRGRYSDDLNLPGQAYAVMLRSPHAHALIRAIDAAAARAAPGVLAVLTAARHAADGLNPMPHHRQQPPRRHPHPEQGRLADRAAAAAADDRRPRSCHVGEIVAVVVADRASPRPRTRPSWSQSTTTPLPAVTAARRRRERDAPRARRQPQRHPRRRGRRRARRPRRPSPTAAHVVAVRHLGAARRRRADGAARRGRRVRPRRPANTRCMPAPAARSARGATWRWCSACRPSRCAW